jgi:hypothetical protein
MPRETNHVIVVGEWVFPVDDEVSDGNKVFQ